MSTLEDNKSAFITWDSAEIINNKHNQEETLHEIQYWDKECEDDELKRFNQDNDSVLSLSMDDLISSTDDTTNDTEQTSENTSKRVLIITDEDFKGIE